MLTALQERAPASGWHGALSLVLARRGMATRLVSRAGTGPLVVQKPLYPEGPGVCHVYLLHPPGGMAGGDSLHLTGVLEADAHALLTTPAAAKFYRSAALPAEQRQTLRVGPRAALEWLPQDNIYYAGSDVRLDTLIDLEADARFLGWDMHCLGLPASGDHYRHGRLVQRTEIRRGDRPLLLECNRLAGGSAVAEAPWGLAGHTVTGTLYALPAQDEHVSLAREALAVAKIERGGASRINDVLVARCLSPDAERCRTAMAAVWMALREPLLGLAPCPPRIWNT